MAETGRQQTDPFARIAAQRVAQRDATLQVANPRPIPDTVFTLDKLDANATFIPPPRLDSKGKLEAELSRQRRKHAKFLRDLAPPTERTRDRFELREFDWRVETDEDLSDFSSTLAGAGRWEKVKIPHYGAPLGKAVTYYRTEFDLDESMFERGRVWLCFRGVDYIAHAFVNGAYIGSHEGFFAPFEFDVTSVARRGRNTLLVKVENDAIMISNDSWGDDGALYEGDKLYAATGPGYDDPTLGWHHCPPAMGIYQGVYIESRSELFISDIFVRPILAEDRAEAWVEVYNCDKLRRDASIDISVYGQNFRGTIVRRLKHKPSGELGPGVNYLRVSFEVPNARAWDPEQPWLYQAQVRLFDGDGVLRDARCRQFGMRSFVMDETSEPRGKLYLNGREIKLRGANTMGFEQQDVIKGDWDQLIDDILLAKICYMNYWRLTQRPVQEEVYDYCDRLGLMTQTDLPLFGVLRRNKFCEAVKQSEEMERLVRSHPCNVMISYINEPFHDCWGKPHRHLTRPEMESFFAAASEAVRLANPDRVIKPVDGDYDPPGPGLPDNHCYTGWYNGHGIELGKLHKGYWQATKPGWMHACGEFGAEGLDPAHTMRKHYPHNWLPQSREEERHWTPDRIPHAQTGRFHYLWFDTQYTLRGWVRASHEHQAAMTRLMADAFRRDKLMNSFAIHLFIDAFPSGWMKTIMDVDRNPKPAYFAYRDALAPVAVQLRADRTSLWAGEESFAEVWICNDTHEAYDACLRLQLVDGEEIVLSKQATVGVEPMSAEPLGRVRFTVPKVASRKKLALMAALVDESGKVISHYNLDIDAHPPVRVSNGAVGVVGSEDGPAARLVREIGMQSVSGADALTAGVIVADGGLSKRELMALENSARAGASVVMLDLPVGEHKMAGGTVSVEECGMGARHFVSRATGHPLVKGFGPSDFAFWYDPAEDCISPILRRTLVADRWKPILTSGNGDWSNIWRPTMAAAEKRVGKGRITICLVELAGRVRSNPVAMKFAARLLGEGD